MQPATPFIVRGSAAFANPQPVPILISCILDADDLISRLRQNLEQILPDVGIGAPYFQNLRRLHLVEYLRHLKQ